MSEEAQYLNCLCDHCSQKLEFPADADGSDTQCPACGKNTRLRTATSSPLPTPVRPPRSMRSGGELASTNLIDIRVRVSRKAATLTVAVIFIIAVGTAALVQLKFNSATSRLTAVAPPEDQSLSAVNKQLNEPPGESTEVITFADPPGLSPHWASFRSYFKVQIHRIIKGEKVVETGKLYSTQVDDSEKEPLYFEVSVKNIGFQDEKYVSGLDFKLIDESG
jgi:hypothetical protein